MRLIRAKDYNDVSRKAANIIAAQIYLKPDCVLGLATGSSPVGTYKELIAKYEAGDLDFSQVRTVNLDEYVGLTKDHDQSYAYFMRSNLFDHVNIDQNNCNIPNGMNPDAEAECARYDAVIDAFAEHQHARDGMELVCLQIVQMLFDEVVICKRIELEVIELSIGEFHDAGNVTAHRLDFLLLASKLRINKHRHLRHIESTCG